MFTWSFSLTGLVDKYEWLWATEVKLVVFAVCPFGFPRRQTLDENLGASSLLGDDRRKLVGEWEESTLVSGLLWAAGTCSLWNSLRDCGPCLRIIPLSGEETRLFVCQVLPLMVAGHWGEINFLKFLATCILMARDYPQTQKDLDLVRRMSAGDLHGGPRSHEWDPTMSAVS